MDPASKKYGEYLKILREELVPAMGCTEPIALAFAASKAREVLGAVPDACTVEVSGNIIKNAKSVIVPNTNGLKGIGASVAAGIIAGKSSKMLEVLTDITETDKDHISDYLEQHQITVVPYGGEAVFYIAVTLSLSASAARVVIENYHTNIVLVEKNGEILFSADGKPENDVGIADRSLLNMRDIYDFAESVRFSDIEELIGRQIQYNSAIASEGLSGSWGAGIGKILLNTYGKDIKTRAKAFAAAASDARMGGCEMLVIILSGSGNQSLATSLPVIEYAIELKISGEKLCRALALADLITIYQKTSIGRLSAFCGAVSAGASAGAGIAYLLGGDYEVIAHTIVNALAIVSGMVCDGAKPSCAAKIAAAVDAGILGYYMFQNERQFWGGDGIVVKGVDNTIASVGRLASQGMRETDREIISIMIGKSESC